MEVRRFRAAADTKVGLLAWIFEINLDTTLPFVLLLIVPALWFIRSRQGRADPVADFEGAATPLGGRRSERLAWALAIVCALTSILPPAAWIASQPVGGKLRTAFRRSTSRISRRVQLSVSGEDVSGGVCVVSVQPRMPELFDQMHVVNEGRFASRYFPGVGLWMTPFLAIGQPYWGQWLAGGLAAFFTFWAGRELAGVGVGFLAGMLTALSPGMGLYSNLLLSHHPTIAALSLFLFAFLRFVRTERTQDAFWAGTGLSFAMLCRPMTAAGFGLPFGIWFLYWVLASRGRQPAEFLRAAGGRWRAAAVLASPIVLGLVLLFFYNRAITGNGLLSPYQLYTDTYTPRHVYGFNNVIRGERRLGPKVLDTYDRWAENLIPSLAVVNVANRSAASARWSLGIVPLTMAGIVFVLSVLWRIDRRWRLVALAILSCTRSTCPTGSWASTTGTTSSRPDRCCC